MHAGDFVVQSDPVGLRGLPHRAGRGALRAARPQHLDRRRPRRSSRRAATSTIVPAYGARAGSAGLLSAAGWARLSGELLSAVEANARRASTASTYRSTAPWAPRANSIRKGISSPKSAAWPARTIPIVISLDLHGILTDRMLQAGRRACDLPHLSARGFRRHRRARRPAAPASSSTAACARSIARVVIPALVRGDELVTKIGCYGDLIRECQRLERDGSALAAGIMIGNPFTDVPELCSQVLVMTDGDRDLAEREAVRLAEEFWPQRFRMQGKLISLDRAIAQARTIKGPVIFTDAADATSSGATGDSNTIIKALARGRLSEARAGPDRRSPRRGGRPRRPASAPPSRSISAAPSIRGASRRCACTRRCSSSRTGARGSRP